MKDSLCKKIAVFKLCIFMLALLAFTALAFSGFIHAGHECSGDDCPVCLLLNTAQRILRSIESHANTHLLLHFLFAFLALAFFFSNSNIQKETPVSKKIRKNN